MSPKDDPEETAKWHRRFAARANNRAWALSEAATRSAEEDEEMLQAAHTAMYHWKIVGNDNQRAHAAQLLAHVYALQQLPHPAKHYLRQATPAFFGQDCAPWELALAHAVAANVAASAGEGAAHKQYHARASTLTEALSNAEEREIVAATLRVVAAPGL